MGCGSQYIDAPWLGVDSPTGCGTAHRLWGPGPNGASDKSHISDVGLVSKH